MNCSPPEGVVPPLVLTPILKDWFVAPVLVKPAPGDPSRLYVVEQGGTIQVVKDGVLSPTPFLDISSRVIKDGELGLLGLAFHPDFANNGRFFVHHSWSDPAAEPGIAQYSDTIVAEYTAIDRDVADSTAWKLVLTQHQPQVNHNGGSLELGPDGMLYLGLGDGGGSGDEHGVVGHGQDPQTWLGKILRIDVTGPKDPGLAYAIPAGNMPAPFYPEIWDYGVRNPYRFSFDACTGDLYIGDVGEGSEEEIDIEPPGMGNRNYGWRLMEGNLCFLPQTDCDPGGLTPPVYTYSHSGPIQAGNASITGGYVYRGSAIPALRGAYFFADFMRGRIFTLRWDGSSVTEVVERTDELSKMQFNISSFGQDAAGEVYVVDYGGSLYRIDAAP